MRHSIADIAKRNISFAIILLLIIAYCGSIVFSFDAFDADNTRWPGRATISHVLMASTPASSHKSNEQEESLGNTGIASDIISRLVRKSLQLFGCTSYSASEFHARSYFTTVSISSFSYLFLLTHIFFIHLKDGCK